MLGEGGGGLQSGQGKWGPQARRGGKGRGGGGCGAVDLQGVLCVYLSVEGRVPSWSASWQGT